MNGYPLSKREMTDLLSAGRESNLYFAAAGAAGGFFLNISKHLMTPPAADVGSVAHYVWEGVRWPLLAVTIFFAWRGWVKQKEGKDRLQEIEDQTEHDED